MSENNFGFNNQNQGGFPPNYSYSWNGSNNGNKNGGWKKVLAIIGIALGGVAIVAGLICASLFGDFTLALPTVSDTGNDASGNSGLNTSTSPEYSRGDYSAPDFDFAPETDIDLSTNLTDIYSQASPACCTVSVSYKGMGYAIGSGFVFDSENGYIATNHHVIEDGDKITVRFYNGQEFEATVIGSDPTTDLAVLHVNVKNLPQLSIGDSNKLKIGQQVIAIGTPYDEALAGTMTTGIVSGIARDIEITNDAGKVVKTMTLIQTDCAINPGNSGGPLIDMAGNVIGINSLKIASEEYENIGFAIPITSAVEVFKKLIAGEIVDGSDIAIASPQIGITIYDVQDGLDYFGMRPKCEYPLGVLVADIDINSAAYRAGLSTYDIITEFAGEKITDRDSLANALAKFRAGDTVTVKVFRFNRTLSEGEYKTVTFKLDAAK
ncbi:MAG: trypsin-like peptidase domain-containing protein [Clostridia bacterium]|nr:trypsin-like peptidase domain-containing protein [Clostridia bacterium]